MNERGVAEADSLRWVNIETETVVSGGTVIGDEACRTAHVSASAPPSASALRGDAGVISH